jgi:TolB-like protein
MSPEQARGTDVDARSDIFSLGSVMYELVTGRSAFEGETASDVIAEILKVEPPPPGELAPEVPPEIEHIIGKALRKDRDSRYQAVRDLLIDLQDYKKEAEFQAKLLGGARPERAGAGWTSRTPARAIPARRPALHPSFLANRWIAPAATLLVALLAIGYFLERRWNGAPTAARPRSLAVLPFRNLKQDPQTDFLGFSLADEIITKLGYVNALTIRPSSSVDKYRNRIIDPKQVAADLKVDTLLTGSFMKDGDDLRINAQLIDVMPDKILWRESFDLKYEKLLTVQDRVAQQIIKELELNLSPAEAANLKPEKPISTAAYEYYLRGIDLYSLNQFAAAIEMLEKSTALEPNYAPPGRTSEGPTPRMPRCSSAAAKTMARLKMRMRKPSL